MSKQASEPGREVTVGHPDYVPPPGVAERDVSGMSVNARRLALGHGGMTEQEIADAQAELDAAA